MAPVVYLVGVGGITVFFTAAYIFIQNNLIGKKNDIENAFSGIDVQLKKRYDLIPNLIDTVKAYMKHEADLLSKITELRSRAITQGLSSDQKVNLNNQLSQSLGNLRVSIESYPELKANQNFEMLFRSLNEVEAQISAARRAYNAAVTDFNNAVEMFPSSIVAKKLAYTRKAVFEAQAAERENISVGKAFQ